MACCPHSSANLKGGHAMIGDVLTGFDRALLAAAMPQIAPAALSSNRFGQIVDPRDVHLPECIMVMSL